MRQFCVLFAAAFVWQAAAQTTISPDSSGNNMLQGNYNFRQVIYSTDTNGNITRSSSVYGSMVFDGKGSYTITGQTADSQTSSGQPQAFQVTGAYTVGSNGMASMDDPLVSGEKVLGGVAQGVFTGSSTEGQVNDIVVAIPAGATPATNSSFQGNYWVGLMDFPGTDPTQVRDALFQISANGAGAITVPANASGYVGTNTAAVVQSLQNVTYSFSNGTGTLTIPGTAGSSTLISGAKTFYVSPDGNFAIGGSPSGYDLFFAVRASSGTATNALFNGLYFTTGMDEDISDVANSGAILDTYWGSQKANGAGVVLRHQRVAPFDNSAFGWTYDTSYTLNADGTYDRPAFRYAVGANGLGFIGIGKSPVEGMVFGVRLPDFTGTGVYLNPTGVLNAASFAPFTSGIAPGEFITLFGTNLAPSVAVASSTTFPGTLNGVQVLINGNSAPIYSVSPTQISAIVPYGTATSMNGTSYAQVKVISNNTSSNTVTVYANPTAPGVFSSQNNGIGTGAILHANFSVVTAANPAKRGETLLVYLTGLGAVTPAVTEGVPAPSTTLSNVNDQVYVYIDGQQATVSFAGLAPGFAGLYQLNVVVPATVTSPNSAASLDINTTDGETTQVTIPIQ